MRSGLPRWIEGPAAAGLLLLTAPLLLLLALAVLLGSGTPVFFGQDRVGRGGRPFRFVKLRTMVSGRADGPEVTARGDARVTRLGGWLRRTKLDELPGLWHVVRGEMSFVGPRPEVPRYVDADSEAWRAVLAARPGLTDPTTLRLYDEESLLAEAGDDPETFYRQRLLPFKLAAQRAYLERRSWKSDLGVLWATGLAVLGHRGADCPPVTLRELDAFDRHA